MQLADKIGAGAQNPNEGVNIKLVTCTNPHVSDKDLSCIPEQRSSGNDVLDFCGMSVWKLRFINRNQPGNMLLTAAICINYEEMMFKIASQTTAQDQMALDAHALANGAINTVRHNMLLATADVDFLINHLN